jgi:peptide/nickel transport system substrate-binding protein
MKHFAWLWLAASSLSFARMAVAQTRPQYGGTLHIAVREEMMSLDPRDPAATESITARNLLGLIFETLVTLDDRGRVHPALATSWQAAPGNQRWQLAIRRAVKFHDGTELTAEIAASDLRMANPAWKVFAEGDFVIVECDHDDPNLPAELALSRHSILKKNGAVLSGTGPFRIEEWQPGRRLTLRAEENYWRGRVFLDEIEVEMGRNFREQLMELESGRVDLIEVAPEQEHRVAMEGVHVSSSQPVELLALFFAGDVQNADEKLLRAALAHCVERGSMRNVLLQGVGQAGATLLPDWMTGYGFSFSSDADLKLAQQEREQVRAVPNWTLGYDPNDTLARTLAERIALNAKDAGLILRPTTSSAADVRLVRVAMVSADSWVELESLAGHFGMPSPKASGSSMEDIYAEERELLAHQRVIPLFHLPVVWAASPALKDWAPGADGSWHPDEVWMGPSMGGDKEKP